MAFAPSIPTLFVTATDTEVGKTAVAASLAAMLRGRGRSVGVIKPFASGCEEVDGRLVSADGLCLARAAGADDPHELVCPVRLRAPLAPTVAAELEGRRLSLEPVRAALEQLAARHDCLIVEGIGGLMVPLAEDCSVADLAVELAAPLLVVARPALGTLNHSLLTVSYARSRGLDVAAVLLNAATPAQPGLAEQTNPRVLRELLGDCPVLGPLGRCEGVSVERGELNGLPEALAALPGVEALIDRVFGT